MCSSTNEMPFDCLRFTCFPFLFFQSFVSLSFYFCQSVNITH